jgi:hypothetical protein
MRFLIKLLNILRGLALMFLIIAIISGEPLFTAFAGGAFFTALASEAVLKADLVLRPSMLIALTFAVQFNFANALAMMTINKSNEARYLYYAVPGYFFEASLIGVLGGLAMYLGAALTERRQAQVTTRSLFHLRLNVSEKQARAAILIIFLLAFIASIFATLDGFGTIKDLIKLIPVLAIFLWSRQLHLKEKWGWFWLYLMVTTLFAYAFFFAFLRSEIIMPILFAFLGLMYAHGIKFLRSTRLIPLWGLFLVFTIIFPILGQVRSTAGLGIDKYEAVTIGVKDEQADSGESLLARSSTVNQLTQIVRLTKDNGFYDGLTMEYLAFVFIPRFVWPEKPMVAMGQWFAAEIGQGRLLESGEFSNSINMTIPGEFYLNFGWVGVALGCFFVGSIIGVIYRFATVGDAYNILGGAMLAYVLWVAATTGADFQQMISLVAVYLVLLITSFGVELVSRKSSFNRGTRAYNHNVRTPARRIN